jgi:ribosomal small subunit protein bTHX
MALAPLSRAPMRAQALFDARHQLFSPKGLIEENTMGKGDIRTKRGKIIRGTYGKTRNRKVKTKYEDQVAKPQA